MTASSGGSVSAIVAEWFADALTWESFQVMSDHDMARSLLDSLSEQGLTVAPSADSSPLP